MLGTKKSKPHTLTYLGYQEVKATYTLTYLGYQEIKATCTNIPWVPRSQRAPHVSDGMDAWTATLVYSHWMKWCFHSDTCGPKKHCLPAHRNTPADKKQRIPWVLSESWKEYQRAKELSELIGQGFPKHSWRCCCSWLLLYSAILELFSSRLTARACDSSLHEWLARFRISTEVVYLQCWRSWCHMKLLSCQHVLCTPYNPAPCHFMQSRICRVHACLAVTCHLHFWQNDRDLLRATAVTQGWNRHWNKSQKVDPGEENYLTAPARIWTRDLSIMSPALSPLSYPRSPWRRLKFRHYGCYTFTLFSGELSMQTHQPPMY